MKLCLTRRSDYILIIEDDALPVDDFLNILDHILKHKLLQSRKFAFLKLYYPERWQGFGKEEIKELFIGGCSIGLIFGLPVLKQCGTEFKKCTVLNYLTGLLLIVSITIYCIATAYTLGRQHILELLKLSKATHFLIEAPGCCTQAVLYSQDMIKPLVNYLEFVTCGYNFPKDIAMDSYARERNLQRYLIIPNLFSNIGYYSSIKSNTKDPREFHFLIPPQV